MALFNPNFNNKTTLAEAIGKSKPNLKSFSASMPVDQGIKIDIYTILAEIFGWFPQKPEADETAEEQQ